MFRWLVVFTISILAVSPSFVFAQDVQETCGGADETAFADCTCGTDEETLNADPVLVTSTSECISACQDLAGFGDVNYFVSCQGGEQVTQGTVTASSLAEEKTEFQAPVLNVQIPGLTFTTPTEENGFLRVNFIGEYVAALYSWLIGAAALIAVVLVMIGGVQWMLAGGNAATVEKAKKRIGDAFTGLVLIMAAYTIAFFIDPGTTQFGTLELKIIDPILLEDTSGAEGTSGGADASSCDEAVANAKQDGTCTMTQEISSPVTTGSYSCNYHFHTVDYDYTQITGLDYPAGWGSEIIAPFDGVVSYAEGSTADRCGNRIFVNGSGGFVTLCHVKDFLNADGVALTDGTVVTKGDVIGHVGGACCQGETPPESWSQADRCTYGGTPCTDPKSNASCSCQPFEQSGNTSGPHVHMTLARSSGSDLLACHD